MKGPAPAARLPWPPKHIDGHIGPQVDVRRWPEHLKFEGRFCHVTNRGGLSDFARISGIQRRQLQDWKRRGVTIDGADRIADALGLHPFDIWGPAYFAIQGVYDEEAA